ncbi:Holliday junction DNA helicase [Desulfosporosinus meridiei]|uniref:Holliday junction resolvase n=1 Tax=Desulfosporosinus meridiei (strain ATCC BAA-275 / DSM 13257 / KCTC 12902 / NCIMB 13706 / S10) TaxID=768704 RepID=J7IQK4_DESMD|nr:Holliday junction DNA helicase [Desulfosporosinus meridiei]AFQ42454.1 Holliday junction resolvase [Desulfosporosinus meridiei DSM 13257]
MNNPTSMEKIKAYHSIKNFLDEEQQKQIAEMLKLTSLDIEKRLWGKDNEVEFILMIYLLQWCKNIVGFEEGIAKLTDTVASDLYIELISGEKIVVEIKSSEDSKYKISENIFNRKEEFAKKFNAKLYFAIKLAGYWTLYSSDYLKSQNRKITIEQDFSNSEFNKIFGDRTFIFPKGLKIISLYSKQATEHMGITNDNFGNLIKYRIEYLGRKILTVNSPKNDKYFMVFLYENLQDIMSNDKQTIYQIDSDRTMIEEEFTNEAMMNLSGFILSPIKHMMSELGHAYNFSEYLTNLIDSKEHFLTRQHILYALSYLAEYDYPIMEKRENEIYLFKDMII